MIRNWRPFRAAVIAAVTASACGSRPAPAPVVPAEPVEEAPPVEPEQPSAAEAPRTVFDRLRDADGPLNGFAAYRLTLAPDARFCGGINVIVARDPNAPVATDDALFAAFLEVRYPDDLDFSPQTQTRSTQRFREWLEAFTKASRAALDHYLAQRSSPDPRVRAIATARITQVAFRTASGLLRVQMPRDVAAGEFSLDKKAAFCDKLRERGEPLLAYAEKALGECTAAVAAAPAGWWTAVCAAKQE